MSELKNTFKGEKYDSKGCKLKEEIGKGINEKHLIEVLKERGSFIKDETLTLKIEGYVNNKLHCKAIEMGVSKSFIVQELIKNFLKID